MGSQIIVVWVLGPNPVLVKVSGFRCERLTGLQASSQTLPGAFIQMLFHEPTENMVLKMFTSTECSETSPKPL